MTLNMAPTLPRPLVLRAVQPGHADKQVSEFPGELVPAERPLGNAEEDCHYSVWLENPGKTSSPCLLQFGGGTSFLEQG